MTRWVTFYIRGSKPRGKFLPLISWLMRLIIRSKISHVFYCFPIMNKIFHVYFNSIRYEDPEYLNSVSTYYVFKCDVTYESYMELIDYCNATLSRRKGYMIQLLGVAMTLPFRLVGVRIHNPLRKFYTSMTCSQHIATALITVFDLASNSYMTKMPYVENWTQQDVVDFLDNANIKTDKIKVTRIKHEYRSN